MNVEFDTVAEMVDKFRAYAAEHDIGILNFIEHGPGGGNPCFTVIADTRESMQALVDFYWPPDKGGLNLLS